MNKNVVFIMVGAFVVAILVALIVQKKFSPKATAGAGAGPVVEILVADEKLQIGDTVEKDKVRWQSWPEDAVFKGAIVRSKQKDEDNLDIYGERLRRTIDRDEPISTKAIVPESKEGKNFLAARLEPGMRAISIPVKASSSVGGFVRPGDYVDVLLTYQVRLRGEARDQLRNTIARYATQTVLSNVKVLAVDQSSKEENREAKVGRTVTLQVDKKSAEALALAEGMGDLSLALRSLGDKDTPQTASNNPVEAITTDVLISDTLKYANDLLDRASVSKNTVRIYNGSAFQDISVRQPTRKQ